MRALRIAEVLIHSQIRLYRYQKHTILIDALIALSTLPIFIFPSVGAAFVEDALGYVNSTIGLETAKIVTSSILAALIFLNSAVSSGKLVVSRDHYTVFLYPIGLKDFVFGRLIASTFDFIRFSLPLFATLYSISNVAGGISSAFLAYFVILLGSLYLSALSTLFTLINKRALMFTLAILSLLDIVVGKAVISLFVYAFIDAIQSSYSNPRLIPFIPMVLAAFTLLAAVSDRVWIDVEKLDFTPRVKIQSSANVSWFTKPAIELRRMKALYLPLLSFPSYLVARILSSYIPSGLPDYFAIYLLIPVVSFMDFLARQESSTLWIYRTSNSVDVFSKNVILKTALGGFAAFLPCVAFLYPLVSDLRWIYVSALSLSFMSVVCSALAIRDLSKPEKSVRVIHMLNSRHGTRIWLVQFISLSLIAMAVYLASSYASYHSAVLVVLPILAATTLKKLGEEVEVV